MINNPYQSYSNTSIMTANPAELTLMLYNGAIKFLKQAKFAMEQKKIEETNLNIQRAQNIITELNVTLKMEYEVSKTLRPLYEFMDQHLLDANVKKDGQRIQDVLDLLEELRDTWAEAMKLARIHKSEPLRA